MTSTKRISFFLLGAVMAAAIGCSPNTPQAPNVPLSQGGGTVLAVGDGYVAGLMNGGLRSQGQQDGFANLVSQQVVGTSVVMSHPFVRTPGIGIDPTRPGTGTLYVKPDGSIDRDPIPGYGEDPEGAIFDLLSNVLHEVPYDNLGVPLALTSFVTTVIDTLPDNPFTQFYPAILRNRPTGLPPRDTTQMDQIENLVANVSAQPQLLLLWIGMTDMLFLPGGPMMGGAVSTPPAQFETAFNGIVARVEALEVEMVAVGNIASVTSMPYFTAVPPYWPPPPFSRVDGDPWNTDEADVVLILLPAQQLLFLPTGEANPAYLPGGPLSLPGSLTLTSAELGAIESAVDAYNAVIAGAASARGWALADVQTAWDILPTELGTPANRIGPNDPENCPGNGFYGWGPYGNGGALAQNVCAVFSLDGVSPTERGYGYTANVFLDAINATYRTNYQRVTHADIQNTNGFSQAP